MKKLNRSAQAIKSNPIRVLQYGEGNFLRAFVDWIIDQLNERAQYATGVAVVQPIEQGMVRALAEQGGLYHHLIQGIEHGELVDEARLVTCIQTAINPFVDPTSYYTLAAQPQLKLIFSNTTEAGIVFDANDQPDETLACTFPGKITQFLKKRYDALGAAEESHIGIIPCELVEANGDKLKACIGQYIDLWKLEDGFKTWIETHVHFANTLVDRIVPGYPKDEMEAIRMRIGFEDSLVVKSESFHLFVIEGDAYIQAHFPAHKHGLNVKYVDSITPYRTQKVRILNGAHTAMVPVGLLANIETVRETMEDVQLGEFVQRAIFDEIVPTINLLGEDPAVFANQVIGRFKNPFIRHELISISLNSISKWRVRVLPTVIDFLEKNGELPKRLTFSLACLINMYLSDAFDLKDDEAVLATFAKLKGLTTNETVIHAVLSNAAFWGQDLTLIPGMYETVTNYYTSIQPNTVRDTLTTL
jgi:tagaturonate reductase